MSDSDNIIETSRLERMRDLVSQSAEGDTGLAEAQKAAERLMKAVDDHLAGNLKIAADPDLYRLAYKAFESLFELNRALVSRR